MPNWLWVVLGLFGVYVIGVGIWMIVAKGDTQGSREQDWEDWQRQQARNKKNETPE